jgi:hypothetical protein
MADQYTTVRTLIGDTASAIFTNANLDVFIQLSGANMTPLTNSYSSGTNDADFGFVTEYFLAAALALRAYASKVATNLQEVRIGDYLNSSGRNQSTALLAAADAYEKMYKETPAWAIIESDESDLNALITIRNFVLRTNP